MPSFVLEPSSVLFTEADCIVESRSGQGILLAAAKLTHAVVVGQSVPLQSPVLARSFRNLFASVLVGLEDAIKILLSEVPLAPERPGLLEISSVDLNFDELAESLLEVRALHPIPVPAVSEEVGIGQGLDSLDFIDDPHAELGFVPGQVFGKLFPVEGVDEIEVEADEVDYHSPPFPDSKSRKQVAALDFAESQSILLQHPQTGI